MQRFFLVSNLIFLLGPLLEGFEGSVAHEVFAGNGSLGVAEVELVVDERVVEVDCLGIGFGVSIADATHTPAQ